MAAAFAKRCGAKRLVLNHFSSRYSYRSPPEAHLKLVPVLVAEKERPKPVPEGVTCIEDLVAQAQADVGADCDVIAAHDLMTVSARSK